MASSKTLKIGIRVIPKKLSAASVQAFDRIQIYDWILFTSKHAAEFFIKEINRRRLKIYTHTRIAAVGSETARVLRSAGFRVDFIPKQFTVNDMVQGLGSIKKSRIFFPRSAIAPMDAIKTLRKRGAQMTIVPLYTSVAKIIPRVERDKLLAGYYSRMAFKSPSGVWGLMKQLNTKEKQIARKIPAECIGPTTAAAARSAGFEKISIKT